MLAGFLFFAIEPAVAITILPSCARGGAGASAPPGLDCALGTFRNVASLIVGVTGSFALLMFTFGGFMLLTSGGVESRVTKGKEILKNAIIGIVLVFSAGYLIDYGVNALRGRNYVQVGAACNDGRGREVDIPDRGLICQTPCTRMAGPDAGNPIYSCQDETLPGITGCNIDYTGCSGAHMKCCLTPPPAPPETPNTTPVGPSI
ncbi:MAG: Type secretion system pilin [Candidatus Parcubacteria bacterium]